jgi:hypothetical protein
MNKRTIKRRAKKVAGMLPTPEAIERHIEGLMIETMQSTLDKCEKLARVYAKNKTGTLESLADVFKSAAINIDFLDEAIERTKRRRIKVSSDKVM